MEKLVKVEYLIERGNIKKGTICNCPIKDAKFLVELGHAKILDVLEMETNKTLTFEERKILENNAGSNKKLIDTLNKEFLDEQDINYCRTFLNKINDAPINSKYLKILQDPKLFNNITEIELDKKIVKEIETRKCIFLCSQGRLVENCQIASYNLLVNDEAGAGKDYITSKTLEMNPEENYIKKTRISPTVFTYWHNSQYEPEWSWDGKIFYTEDISENVLNSEVFKVMCSSGSQATIVIRQRAIDINIKGKPVIITTTANSIPNPELTRRFEIVCLDESIDQTKEIMKRHSEYAVKGISPEYNQDYIEALGFLKRVKVKIPYAESLTKIFPATSIMMRTKFPRFLDLIRASTAFHQYQRVKDEEGFLLATKQDYEIASEVMKKLISNKYLISLTKKQKKIIDFFESISQVNPNFNESSTRIREQMCNFISLPAMITNLSILSGYGLLNVHIEEQSNGKEVEKYELSEHIKKGGDFVIFPDFDYLIS